MRDLADQISKGTYFELQHLIQFVYAIYVRQSCIRVVLMSRSFGDYFRRVVMRMDEIILKSLWTTLNSSWDGWSALISRKSMVDTALSLTRSYL